MADSWQSRLRISQYTDNQHTVNRPEGAMSLKPGALARRFQSHAVAAFNAEAAAVGADITPVQYAVLSEVRAHPGLDQATLAGRVALDRTTTSGVVDRLAEKRWVPR